MNRQEGYYWIKHHGKFKIALWFNVLESYFWSLCYSDELYFDSDFEHINEVRIKIPGELPD